jgi:hypothetical protein
MVVEIFVAQGDGDNPLSEQGALVMDDESGITWVGNRRIEGAEESDLVGEFPEDERTTVCGQLSAQKIGVYRFGAAAGKIEGLTVTVCHSGGLAC